MAPTFSAPRTNITVSASLDRSVSRWDVQDALASLARDHGIDARDFTVEITPGARTVTLTEDEYNALVNQGGSESNSGE